MNTGVCQEYAKHLLNFAKNDASMILWTHLV